MTGYRYDWLAVDVLAGSRACCVRNLTPIYLPVDLTMLQVHAEFRTIPLTCSPDVLKGGRSRGRSGRMADSINTGGNYWYHA
jgi:hypothetical protein